MGPDPPPLVLTPSDVIVAARFKVALLAALEARKNRERAERDATAGSSSPTLLRIAQEADTAAIVEKNAALQIMVSTFLELP